MIRVVVADDEPVARRGLVRLLRDDPELKVVGEATDGTEALELMKRERPDVAFLDIQMPGLDGMAVAEAIHDSEAMPLIVFVTAYDEHAVQAFELEAVDYVLKPIDRERVRQVVARVRRQLRRAALDDIEARTRVLRRLLGDSEPTGGPDRLVVRESGSVFFVRPDEVDWIESAGNYVRVHVGSRSHLVRSTLGDMQDRLERHGFLRIRRSALVNLDRVRQVDHEPGGKYVAVLESGRHLRASRRSVPALRRAIERLE